MLYFVIFLGEEDSKWKAFPGLQLVCEQAAPYVSLKASTDWGRLTDTMCSSSSEVGRRKRQSTDDVVQIRSSLHPRVPRGIPLVLSAVNQTGEHFIGSVLNAGSMDDPDSAPLRCSAEYLDLPAELITAEQNSMRVCSLISKINFALYRRKVLKATECEWKKYVDQGAVAVRKAKSVYASTTRDHYLETSKFNKELVETRLMLGLSAPVVASVTKSGKITGKKNKR